MALIFDILYGKFPLNRNGCFQCSCHSHIGSMLLQACLFHLRRRFLDGRVDICALLPERLRSQQRDGLVKRSKEVIVRRGEIWTVCRALVSVFLWKVMPSISSTLVIPGFF